MTEEVLRGQESQLFQTNSQQLLFFLFSAGRKRRNGLHRHLFRHAQEEECLWDGWFGRGDNKTASLQPPLRLGPVYSWMTVLGPQWKCVSQTTPDKCSVWLLAAQTNSDPICHSSADWSFLFITVCYKGLYVIDQSNTNRNSTQTQTWQIRIGYPGLYKICNVGLPKQCKLEPNSGACWDSYSTHVARLTEGGKTQPYEIKRTQAWGLPTTSGRRSWCWHLSFYSCSICFSLVHYEWPHCHKS